MATRTITTAALAGSSEPQTIRLAGNGTSHPPPEDFWTLDGMLRSHARQAKQKPLIYYPVDNVDDYEGYTASTLSRFVDAAVWRYIRLGLQPADPTLPKAPVAAILAPSSLEVVVTFFALNRMGYATLFLSTRLTLHAWARLLGMADCGIIIASDRLQDTVRRIGEERECQYVPLIKREHYHRVEAPDFERQCDPAKESGKMAWILHSSGSTGLPKPIFLTNYQCLANFRKSFALKVFCASPLFHSHGLMELGRAFYTKCPMYLWNYAYPITNDSLSRALAVSRPEQMSVVPYILKLLAESGAGINLLAQAKIVLFGGSSCPDDLGDRLTAHDVNLVANYGATETGRIMTSFRPAGDKEWNYLRLEAPIANHTLMDEIAPGIFECVALDGLPSKGPSNSDNPPNSFRTADLFSRHPDPDKSNFYKYLSRLDDRITLVNGEKVLPIPIEGRIRQDELVKEAVVFGFERSVPGVLVVRSERAKDMDNRSFTEAIWPAIEAANAGAETFSRIPLELTVVLPFETVYPQTDKGTCIRAQMYQQFADIIDHVYQDYEEVDGGTLRLSPTEIEDWLLVKFRSILHVPLKGPNDDIFAAGVDSLQTMRIWKLIKQELDLGGSGDRLGQNVVFEKATIRRLARYLYQLRKGKDDEAEDETEVMKELIDKYSVFARHVPDIVEMPAREVVIVTGATGNLGAFIVKEMAARTDVAEVWTLIRASSRGSATARVMESLSSRQIQLTTQESFKINAVPSDLGQEELGLDQDIIQYLQASVTSIIHSAWAVNFNIGVRSFESQHIRAVQNLINFSLRSKLPSPARFYFCSSVSIASGTPRPATIHEKIIENLSYAQGMGYGRSKMVSEHIVRNAMQSAGIHARVLRIGQLCGDEAHADWNDTEAIALMVRSALTTRALPALEEQPSWLPVDQCARAIKDIVLGHDAQINSDVDLVYHLLNPRTFSWKSDLLPALARSKLPAFDIVSSDEWLERLRKSDNSPARNPSIKLLDFWRKKYGSTIGDRAKQTADVGDARRLVFETSVTARDCPSLIAVQDPVSTGLVERYVATWLNKWAPSST
ncbi:acetyl-CoA synthetase-like protein [Polychaeton citri CBS 116435]|uniref:Acetyl-CoA synthetase-like protein n=1 Tax=Polychaeton citri CBS 116435 TaxID=1314669 RepID=A0A9P4UR60_9PEZI|nr:acetyl-CoA synthetase-like protein [Polychaeton citri CBS 116435]